MEPAPNIIDIIADGLLGEAVTLVKTRAVPIDPERRNDRGWPELMVAAELDDGGARLEAVFACGPLGGPIFAVNAVAREHTPFGAAARGGSRADDMRNRFLAYPEVEAVLRVLRGT